MMMHSRFTSTRTALVLASAFAIVALALPGQSQAATANASSAGTVVTPINITKSKDLSFGKFAAGTGGTVTVSTSGANSVTGAVVLLSSGTTTAAQFDVSGEAGASYSITIPATATLASGSDTMSFTTVSDLTAANTTSGANVTTGSLTGGAQSIYVGGVLTVGSGQAPGSYTGTLSVAVEYN